MTSAEIPCSASRNDVASSSAGLRVLLKFGKQAKAAKVRLVLARLTPTVKEVFDISGFTSIFEIKPDRGQALASLG